MIQKGNGGYQIVDFEGKAPTSVNVDFFTSVIARGKPLWVNNLVVSGETYQGVASAIKTLTSIIIVLSTLKITIALSNGAVYYEDMSKPKFDIEEDGVLLDENLETTITDGKYQDLAKEIIAHPRPINVCLKMINQYEDDIIYIGTLVLSRHGSSSVKFDGYFVNDVDGLDNRFTIVLKDSDSNNLELSIDPLAIE